MATVQNTFDPDAPPSLDYIVPATGESSMGGNWARRLLDNDLDIGAMRPYLSPKSGRAYVTRNVLGPDGKVVPRKIVTNDTNAVLQYNDWLEIDTAVIAAAKPRLKIVKDLEAAGLVYNLPNGIAKTVLQYQQMSDITGATVSMDALRQSESDRPVFSLVTMPLPIIHKDFQFSLRQVLSSRQGNMPIDTQTAQLAARRVAEQVEQFVLGNTNAALLGQSSYAWGGSTVYGLMNSPTRITYSLTLPTAAGWTPDDTINDILQMRKASQTANHFGPWMLYCGLAWSPYMDADYKPTYNDTTLRERLKMIEGIQDVQTLDYIGGYDLLLVELDTSTIRLVKGMNIVTVQWETHGGFELNYKILCMIVPQVRNDINGNTGLIHGS